MKIILGSASPRRKQILSHMGYDFDISVPYVDEKSIRRQNPEKLVLALSQAKAGDVASRTKAPSLIIGVDVVVVHEGIVREKAGSIEEARTFLQSYSGKSTEIYAGVTVINTATQKSYSASEKAKVYFKEIPQEGVEQILNNDQILDWAGAFGIQDPHTSKFIERIEGNRNTIIGLPVELTKNLLSKAGLV